MRLAVNRLDTLSSAEAFNYTDLKGVRLKCGSGYGTERMRNGTDIAERNGYGVKTRNGTERNGYGVKMRNGTERIWG